MHRNGNGGIHINWNLALGAAVVTFSPTLLIMLLISVAISGDGEVEPEADGGLAPIALADGQNEIENGDAIPQAGSKPEYSNCLARTWQALSLDVKDTEFKPWEESNTTQDT